MTTTTLTIIAMSAYLLAVVGVALFGRHLAESADMFNVFGRSAGAIRAASGYLGLIGAGELITFSQLGYDSGLDVLWLLVGFAIGFLILALLSDKVRLAARGRGINTIAGYFGDNFGPAASVALSVISVVSLGSLLAIQFILGSELIFLVTGLPREIAMVLIGAIIAMYLIPTGIVGVLSTDVLRAIMMTIVLIVIVAFTAVSIPHLNIRTIPTEPLAWPDRATFFILGVFGTFCGADVWQTVLASKSKAVVRKSLFTAACGFVSIGVLIAFIGIITRSQVPSVPADSSAFLTAIKDVIPSSMAPLVAVLIIGSIMATADTEIWVISSLVLGNIFPSAARSAEAEGDFQDRIKRLTQFIIPIVVLVAIVVAYLSRDARALYEGLLVLLTVLGPSHVAIVMHDASRTGIVASLWSGILAFFIVAGLYKFALPVEYSLIPLAVSVVAYFAGWFVERQRQAQTKVG
jgi:Na+/proline symporter